MSHEEALLDRAVETLGEEERFGFESGRALRHGEVADESEQRVIRQVVEALLYEGLVEFESQPRAQDASSSGFEPVYDLRIDFEVGEHAYRCVAAIKSFSRVRVAPGSVSRFVGGELRGARLIELIRALDIDTEGKQRLLDELTQTVALSRWNRENLEHQRSPRRHLDFQALESAIVEGHQYHPCFKTRTGFSLQDHRDYGSEVGSAFQLEWLAVARRTLRIALPTNEGDFWRNELGATELAKLNQVLEVSGGSWEKYSLVPAHPWHLRSIRALGLDRAIEFGDVIELGPAGDFYRASQSLRTLVNATRPEKANVKLPLNVVCTSSHRNLEDHFVCTAPLLSRWLVSLVEGDAYLQERGHLLLLSEYAGILYEPEGDEDGDEVLPFEELRGRLGTIFRESVCGKLEPGEAAVPFTALTLIESDGRPFVVEWIDAHGVERWVDRLLEVVLLPIWHMLVHHGVAFEAHAQNLILIHRDGWPTRIVLRDFHEDTEFVPDYLRSPEQAPRFETVDPFFETIPDDDGYRMASTDALRELFMDCVYVYNLADVAFLIERFFGFSDEEFWRAVRAKLAEYERSGITDQARIDRVASDSAEIIVESLLKKKILDGGVLDYFEHSIRNTLVAEESRG